MLSLTKKKKCFMCNSKIAKDADHATIKYRYELDKVDEVHVCLPCVDKYNLGSEVEDGESI